MKFSKLAEYYEKLEATSKRSELVDILSQLFKEVKADEIGKICYLIQGRVAPFFEPTELGMAESLAAQAVGRAFDKSKVDVLKLYRQKGNMGIAAKELAEKIKNKKSKIKNKKITLADKKILAGIKKLEKETTKYIEKYELGKALHLLYEFFWHQYADVYIETAKKQLADEKARLIKRFEENMADIVNHYVLAAIGNQIDLNDQLEYVLAELEENKKDIIEDITHGG